MRRDGRRDRLVPRPDAGEHLTVRASFLHPVIGRLRPVSHRRYAGHLLDVRHEAGTDDRSKEPIPGIRNHLAPVLNQCRVFDEGTGSSSTQHDMKRQIRIDPAHFDRHLLTWAGALDEKRLQLGGI